MTGTATFVAMELFHTLDSGSDLNELFSTLLG